MDKPDPKIVQLIPAIGWWNGFNQGDGTTTWTACPAFALLSDGSMEAMDHCEGWFCLAREATNYCGTEYYPDGPPEQETRNDN